MKTTEHDLNDARRSLRLDVRLARHDGKRLTYVDVDYLDMVLQEQERLATPQGRREQYIEILVLIGTSMAVLLAIFVFMKQVAASV